MIDREVEIELGDGLLVLRPTLGALKKINRQYGSLLETMRRVKEMDFDAICTVISAGCDASQRERDEIEQKVCETGLLRTVGPLGDYLAVFMDPGGDDAAEEDQGKA